MHNTDKVQILYEIAMGIGSSLDLSVMLRTTLATLLRKLNCAAGAVFRCECEATGDQCAGAMGPIFSLPRHIEKNSTFPLVDALLPELFSDGHTTLSQLLPMRAPGVNDDFYHLLHLPGFGALLLIKNGGDVDPMMIRSLQPLCQKLAEACRACVNAAELEAAHANLEAKVQKRTQELSKAQAYLESLFNAVADGIAVFRLDGTFVDGNRALLKLYGHSIKEMREKRLRDFVPYDLQSDVSKWKWELLEQGSLSLETVNLHSDGSTFPIYLMAALMRDDQGEPTGLVLSIRDIGERERIRAQMELSQKMESIGQLAAGIAHEINTPIQFIGDNTRFMKDSFEDAFAFYSSIQKTLCPRLDKECHDLIHDLAEEHGMTFLESEVPVAIHQTLEGLGQVSRLVQAMRSFSHPGRARVMADLNKAIESTVVISRNEWKYAAEVDMQLDPELPEVRCVVGEINQVILNLIVNAAHAIESKQGDRKGPLGQILIRTSLRRDFVQVSISDTGTGIAEDQIHRIFDPFFTTKEVGKGTGQGLSIAHGIIVKKHGGLISVESKLGEGTTFQIRLPLIPFEPDE
jgi:two-component system, NtrC family, sensor kinase